MSGITDLNIVIQQGNSAKEAQNVRSQPLDPNQLTVAQQDEKVQEERTTINDPEDSQHVRPDDKKEKENEKKQKQKEERNKKEAMRKKDPDATGKLLNTIA